MNDTVRVFVNGKGFDVAAGRTALDAVASHDAEDAARVRAGTLLVTDSRGLSVAADSALFNGAVFRLVPNRERDSLDPAARFDE